MVPFRQVPVDPSIHSGDSPLLFPIWTDFTVTDGLDINIVLSAVKTATIAEYNAQVRCDATIFYVGIYEERYNDHFATFQYKTWNKCSCSFVNQHIGAVQAEFKFLYASRTLLNFRYIYQFPHVISK